MQTPDGRRIRGRQYLWGVAEVENENHCDFKKLRNLLIRNHMLDLVLATENELYESYRASQMETRRFGEPKPRKLDNPKFREEEELLRLRFTDQVKQEEYVICYCLAEIIYIYIFFFTMLIHNRTRFRQWEQRLISERDRLNKDLEQVRKN